VGAAEDLMREHGVLNRVLLIYEEGLRRIHKDEDVSPDVFHKPAMLVRKLVEDYHEKLEENFIFPEFEKKQQHIELVKVLKEQHNAGRGLTDVVLRLTAPDMFRKKRNHGNNWPGPARLSSACTGRMKLEKTPCCSPPSTRS
jgi:hemerythrin-like domain-containing protein